MKKTILFLNTLFVLSAFADTKPLITKVNESGFVMPEYAISERCEVFNDKVLVTKTYGRSEKNVTVVESKHLKVNGDVASLVAKAKAAKLDEKNNGLCDGPSTTVVAGDVLLYNTGGCGSPRKVREGGAAFALRNIVDSHCQVTHGEQE